jgi:hypothetical protein
VTLPCTDRQGEFSLIANRVDVDGIPHIPAMSHDDKVFNEAFHRHHPLAIILKLKYHSQIVKFFASADRKTRIK